MRERYAADPHPALIPLREAFAARQRALAASAPEPQPEPQPEPEPPVCAENCRTRAQRADHVRRTSGQAVHGRYDADQLGMFVTAIGLTKDGEGRWRVGKTRPMGAYKGASPRPDHTYRNSPHEGNFLSQDDRSAHYRIPDEQAAVPLTEAQLAEWQVADARHMRLMRRMRYNDTRPARRVA